MRWCNCGEAASASAQRNAAETKVATNARSRFVERANVLIALRACDLDASCARNFYESLVADVYCDKKPVSGLVAAAALNFSANPISRASRPASIAFLNAFAVRTECFAGVFDFTTNGHESTQIHKTPSLIRRFSLFVSICVDSWLVRRRRRQGRALVAGFSLRYNTRLKSDWMISPGNIRGC